MTGPDATDDHEEVADLLAPWALDAVDDLERARVERHLRSCARCRTDAAELLEAAALLAESSEPAAPPHGLRDHVLAAIERTDQEPRPATSPSRDAPRRDRRSAGTVRTRRLTVVLAGVAAVLVLAVGATATVAALRDRLTTVEDDLERITALATQDTTRTWEASVDGRRLRVLETAGGEGYVLTDGLGATTDEAWVLWTIADGEPTNLGRLATGRDATTLPADTTTTADLVAITLEPDPDVPGPTTEPVVAVELGSVRG